MRRTSTHSAFVLLLVAGCGSAEPPGDTGSDAGSASIGTISAGGSSGSADGSDSNASASGTATTGNDPTAADDTSGGAGETEDGPKFDLPNSPDAGPIDCGGGGGGGGGDRSSFSNIWVANAPQGTVSKIDTESAVEVARYRTTTNPANEPSRTSVNQFGDIAAGHRYAARVVKIAAQEEDCIDLNANGSVDTSTGPADI